MLSERQPAVAVAALAFVVLNNVVASTLVLAAYGFDVGALGANLGSLPVRGPAAANLLRGGGLIDMVGYLALAPVVLYLGGRLRVAAELPRRRGLVDILTFSGLGFALVGSIGAVLLASQGPALLQASTVGPAEAAAARVSFPALASGVYVGLWGTLEQLLLGIWLMGSRGSCGPRGGASPGLGLSSELAP